MLARLLRLFAARAICEMGHYLHDYDVRCGSSTDLRWHPNHVRSSGTGRPSGLPAANGEPWSAVAVAAIVVAGASVVVVAPAGEVAGVVVIAQDIARSSGPPAASIILVADQIDLVDVGDFSGADRPCVEGRGRKRRKRAARHRMRPSWRFST